MKRIWRKNGSSIALLTITRLTLAGNLLTGWHDFNNELTDYRRPLIGFIEYLTGGHGIESVFENGESEFRQMGLC